MPATEATAEDRLPTIWSLPDELWERIAPLLKRRYPPARTGRPRADLRLMLDGIIFRLRTGCQWKALPRERFGSASAIHKRFLEWEEVGFFEALWKAGLAEYDEMEGIAWRWQSIDGAMTKAPLAQENVGRNPTDRGKKRKQAPSSGGRAWGPDLDSRDRSKPA